MAGRVFEKMRTARQCAEQPRGVSHYQQYKPEVLLISIFLFVSFQITKLDCQDMSDFCSKGKFLYFLISKFPRWSAVNGISRAMSSRGFRIFEERVIGWPQLIQLILGIKLWGHPGKKIFS